MTTTPLGPTRSHLQSARFLLFLADAVLVDCLTECRPGGAVGVFSFTETKTDNTWRGCWTMSHSIRLGE